MQGQRELKAEFFYDLPNGNKEPIISPEGGSLVLTLSVQAVRRKRCKQNSSELNVPSHSTATAALDISPYKMTLHLRGHQDIAISFRPEGDRLTDLVVANPVKLVSMLGAYQTAEQGVHNSTSEWENNCSSVPSVLN